MSENKIPFWKHFLFSEAQPIVEIGKERIFSETDTLNIPTDQVPEDLSWFEPLLDFSSGSRLIWSNLKALGWKYRRSMLLCFCAILCGLVTPYLVNQFIQLLSSPDMEAQFGNVLMFGIALGLSIIAQGFFTQHYFYDLLGCEQISTRVLNKKIYLQSLRLGVEARGKTPVGDIVNHMSTDSDGVSEFTFVFAELFETVVTIFGVSVLLFYYLGWTALAPLGLFFLLVPVTKRLASRFTHLDDEMMRWRDKRVTLMTQILTAIRLVKYFVWEKSVMQEVEAIRSKELQARKKMAQTEVMSAAAYTSVSAVVLFATLGVHALREQELSVALVFTCITLFGLIEGPLGRLSGQLARYTNCFVGSRRLVEFLKKEKMDFDMAPRELSREPVAVKVEHLSIGYQGKEPILKDLNFEVPSGKSVAIVGAVGCGKSSLLLTMLEELAPAHGKFETSNSMGINPAVQRAFCPQEAFIINGSLKENLTFGECGTEEEIQEALRITALDQDLRLFPAGLNTEIGEKGVNLSGGQKQRVALARAVLARPAIVFLDDPLSAVDVETEKHLVEKLVFGKWQGLTRIVATHRLESLEHFDQVIFLKDGKIAAQGHFSELMKNAEFQNFYSAHNNIQNAEKSVTAQVHAQNPAEAESRITEDEEREKGAVKSTVYWDYIKSLGGNGPWNRFNLFRLFFGTTCVILMPLAQKAWLSRISEQENVLWAIGVYGILGVITLMVTMGNGLFWLKRGVEAGKNMHNAMLKSVLAAPIRFFDSTPVGRIIQRFSRDIESVDVHLQWTFDSAIHCALQIIVTLALISIILPSSLLVLCPLLVFYYILQRDYRRPAREIKRIDSLARSPRYAHFKETLMGLSVIRGFRKEDYFIRNFQSRLERSQTVFYNHYLLNRWFSVRIPLLGGLIAGSTAVLLALAIQKGYLSSGTGGLLVIYSLSFWGYLNWGVRVFSDIESRMTSVERLKFYSNLPAEAGQSFDIPKITGWPRRGQLTFENVKVRYAPHLPLVLRDVSFTIEPGERIGLIGRTGSGKSTLLQCLFRFVELEEGRIILDDREIREVTLPELRKNLAIIPQDPILFMGSLRSNLDRYNQYTDEEIKDVLIKTSMWDFVSNLPEGLNHSVNENGANFSQGQRQLLCMARALLVKAKIIVLDEATASVDVQTDMIIQKVIRECLKGVTLIIVAHRLGTVMDCDRIIEMSSGQVKDIWRPKERKSHIDPLLA